MAGPSDYHRGEMDIHAQESTYKLFIGLSKWGALYTAALILLLSLWLCAHAGFLRSALATIVMIVLGTLFLADKKKSH